jgi:hypothetical protein
MAGRYPKLDKLRELLNKHTVGGVEDESFIALAEKVIRYAKHWHMASPYDPVPDKAGTGPVIWADKLCPFAAKIWLADVTRAWFADEMEMEMEDEDAEPEKSIFTQYENPAFEDATKMMLSRHFILVSRGDTGRQLYQIEDAERSVVVPVVGKDGDIIKVYARVLAPLLRAQDVLATPARSAAMAAAFERSVDTSPTPKLLGQPGASAYALHRAAHRPDANVPIPYTMQFLNRLNDPEAFAAFWWGVYADVNRGRQCLYVSDTTGEGGKSKFISTLLSELFGERISAAFNAKLMENSSHASASFEGKKMVVAGDCKNRFVIHMGILKELSGDDPLQVNPKYVQPYTTRLECRVCILGNYEPYLTRERHNISRTLWITLAPLTVATIDVDYGEKCAAEIAGFLAYAKAAYERRCPDNYEIRVNHVVRETYRLRTLQGEDDYHAMVGQHIAIDADGVLKAGEWSKIVKECKLDGHKAEDFRNWIQMVYPEIELRTTNNKRSWEISGLRVKTSTDDAREAREAATGAAKPRPRAARPTTDMFTDAEQSEAA